MNLNPIEFWKCNNSQESARPKVFPFAVGLDTIAQVTYGRSSKSEITEEPGKATAPQKASKNGEKAAHKTAKKTQDMPRPHVGPQAFEDLTAFRYNTRIQSDQCSGSEGARLEIPTAGSTGEPNM